MQLLGLELFADNKLQVDFKVWKTYFESLLLRNWCCPKCFVGARDSCTVGLLAVSALILDRQKESSIRHKTMGI